MGNFKFHNLIIAALLAIVPASAQTVSVTTVTFNNVREVAELPRQSFFHRYGVFDKLELGMTLGTTGIGLELASPVTRWAKVRAGVAYTPSFDVPMHFGITTYTDGKVHSGNFGKIQELMRSISGYEMDETIDINGTPKMLNFSFLVDVYPFQNNRHWHFTAGFYAGPRRVAKAINTMQEMPSLLAIGMYNRLYDYTMADGFIDNPIYNDIYLDPEQADMLKEKLEEYGRIGIHLGDFKDGRPYYMEPDKDGTVKAKALVNSFRYYLGAGYGGAMSDDKRWNISVDAGAMFWGGSPKVIDHSGIDLIHDLDNVRGKVGDYLKIMEALKVYPVLNLKISYTFF